MIITGEASGDLHGANLVRAIRRYNNDIYFSGIGGAALKREGVDLFFDITRLSVMGLTEVASKLPAIYFALRTVKKQLKELCPSLLILIDFPGFNLKAAKAARKSGIPVLYYISPKVWAWRQGRIKKIKGLVDHMAVILPFEKEIYLNSGIPATYVGNPLLDNVSDNDELILENVQSNSLIGLLPGSREKEITRILPVMLETAVLLARENNNIKFIISVAPSIDRVLIENITGGYKEAIDFEITGKNVNKIFKKVCFILAASGTVTLEAAIAGVPMVVLYKMSLLSYQVAKFLVKVKYISLVNLIAGREVVPELIQDKASPENTANAVLNILKDKDRFVQVKKGLHEVKQLLGESGASDRTAKIALNMIE
jgi:lipid-A-disaccharide synthase